jgi:hypothetical protein
VKRFLLAVLIILAMAGLGCGALPSTPTSPLSPPPKPPTGTAGEAAIPPGAEQVVALARRDLAQRLKRTEATISVASIEAVDWSDASLGCPEPGMVYAQMITPGYRLILVANGERYEYHTDQGQRAFYCPGGKRVR